MHYLSNRETGFTLIELTVVLLVLIALAGLAIPYMGGTSQAALCRATDVTMQNVKKVIMARYYLDMLGYFPKNTKAGDNDYNLRYLFEHPANAASGGWDDFNAETQLGWRPGGYLQSGVNIAIAPNDSFKTTGGKVHSDIIGTQVLDGWGRPIVIQAFCSDFTNKDKTTCESSSLTWIARLVSAGAGSGLKIDEATIDTPIAGSRTADDRILYLNTSASEINPPCNEN